MANDNKPAPPPPRPQPLPTSVPGAGTLVKKGEDSPARPFPSPPPAKPRTGK